LALVLTTAVLRAFFAIFVIVLVVIFQEELRHLFEQIAKWGLNRALAGRRRQVQELPPAEVEILARTLGDLATARIGALVILAGQDAVEPHVHGGVPVNGEVSEPLLKSIFDPHSMGHDGALLIRRGRVEKLGLRLPLSREEDAVGALGTRHAAALGLSERTDAMCLVVSEERGLVSVARQGALQAMDDPQRLLQQIKAHCSEMLPPSAKPPWHAPLSRRPIEKLTAVSVAALLWFTMVYRSQVISEYFTVTVSAGALPAGLRVVQLSPSAVEIRGEGPRRLVRRLRASEIRIQLPTAEVSPGFQMLPVSDQLFTLPEGFRITDIRPRQVLGRFEASPGLSPQP
jgi:DNA integrity scanning protein DisA with diadenylate cyclase activity